MRYVISLFSYQAFKNSVCISYLQCISFWTSHISSAQSHVWLVATASVQLQTRGSRKASPRRDILAETWRMKNWGKGKGRHVRRVAQRKGQAHTGVRVHLKELKDHQCDWVWVGQSMCDEAHTVLVTSVKKCFFILRAKEATEEF